MGRKLSTGKVTELEKDSVKDKQKSSQSGGNTDEQPSTSTGCANTCSKSFPSSSVVLNELCGNSAEKEEHSVEDEDGVESIQGEVISVSSEVETGDDEPDKQSSEVIRNSAGPRSRIPVPISNTSLTTKHVSI